MPSDQSYRSGEFLDAHDLDVFVGLGARVGGVEDRPQDTVTAVEHHRVTAVVPVVRAEIDAVDFLFFVRPGPGDLSRFRVRNADRVAAAVVIRDEVRPGHYHRSGVGDADERAVGHALSGPVGLVREEEIDRLGDQPRQIVRQPCRRHRADVIGHAGPLVDEDEPGLTFSVDIERPVDAVAVERREAFPGDVLEGPEGRRRPVGGYRPVADVSVVDRRENIEVSLVVMALGRPEEVLRAGVVLRLFIYQKRFRPVLKIEADQGLDAPLSGRPVEVVCVFGGKNEGIAASDPLRQPVGEALYLGERAPGDIHVRYLHVVLLTVSLFRKLRSRAC